MTRGASSFVPCSLIISTPSLAELVKNKLLLAEADPFRTKQHQQTNKQNPETTTKARAPSPACLGPAGFTPGVGFVTPGGGGAAGVPSCPVLLERWRGRSLPFTETRGVQDVSPHDHPYCFLRSDLMPQDGPGQEMAVCWQPKTTRKGSPGNC